MSVLGCGEGQVAGSSGGQWQMMIFEGQWQVVPDNQWECVVEGWWQTTSCRCRWRVNNKGQLRASRDSSRGRSGRLE